VILRKNLSSVVLWSVISAAFIGPGTVTTAASAGSLFQLDLLWAIVFSTAACIVLQELSARLTIVTGESMGQAMIRKHGQQRGRWLNYLVGGPVILGCIAYEAGNILGAVSGMDLLTDYSTEMLTLIVIAVVIVILWTDRRQTIGWIMTILVGIMGITFAVLAYGRSFTLAEYARASFIPAIPAGSELLTLALVGTTIVPYNVFLGSGVSKGQTLHLMRVGLSISVVIGGLITAAILIAGTAVPPFTGFPELSAVLQSTLGPVGGWALGLGLFAAGFSSAITSPYAASIIASSVFGWEKRLQRWVWALVVLTGFLVGISGVKPIPVILLVQALNGLVLPLLTAFLVLMINDPQIVPVPFRPTRYYNGLLMLIFGSILFMGLHSLDKSVSTWLGIAPGHYTLILSVAVATTGWMVYKIFRMKAN
jgi:manganese transport protein